MRAAQIFLLCVNLFFGCVGVAGVCLALYSIVRFDELSSILPVNMLGLMLATSVGICGLAFLGGLAAWRMSSCLLSMYAVLLLAIMSVEVVFGVVVGVYTGNLDVFKSRYTTAAVQELESVVNCTYALCCEAAALKATPCHPLSLVCNTSTVFEVSVPYAVCESLNRYDATLLPAKCGSVATFSSALYGILNAALYPLCATAIALAVVQLACLVLSCCIVCGKYHHARGGGSGGGGITLTPLKSTPPPAARRASSSSSTSTSSSSSV
jgi:hypothetical protein